MLYNKKRDEEFPHDFAGKPRPAASAAPSSHPEPPKPRAAQIRSVIDCGLIITGTLEGDCELRIEGDVRGNIHCMRLTVGDAARIEGSIVADEVVVRGAVKGVIGANRVVLTDGANVESDIFHKKLTIEEGARFDGAARYSDQPMEKARRESAQMASSSAPATIKGDAVDSGCVPRGAVSVTS